MSEFSKTPAQRSLWHALRRRRILIVLTAVSVAAAAFAASQVQPPRYEASTDILFETPVTETLFTPVADTGGDPVRTLQTEVQLVRSEAVEDSVRRRLATGAPPEITVEPVGQSNLIRIIAADRVPQHAAAIANAYADSYIEVRKDMATEARDNAEGALAAEIDSLNRQIDALDQRIVALGASADLASQRDALVSQEATLSTRLREVRVEGAASPGRARVVVPARVPTSPVSPKPLIAAAVGLAFGLLLGMCLALAVDYRSSRRRPPPGRRTGADTAEVVDPGVSPSMLFTQQTPLHSTAHNGHAGAHSRLHNEVDHS